MKAIIYLRVSTEEQALGLEAQESACREWAERAGYSTVGPFQDKGVSGAAGLDKRPGLNAALAALESGDVFLVAKRDRLARDKLALALIEREVSRRKARVVSAAGEGTGGDDPDAILHRGFVDLVSQHERLIIKSRTCAALQAKRRKGERTGGVPYGHELDPGGPQHPPLHKNAGKPMGLRLVPAEQERIKIMVALRDEGVSIRGIARRLNELGIPTKQGKAGWRAGSVQKILNAGSRLTS